MNAVCPDCGKPMTHVDGVPNPRSASRTYLARPCGHNIGLGEAIDAKVQVNVATITGATLVGAERDRQVTEEGYSPDHDEQHTGNELAWAAWCLLDRANAGPDATEQAPPVWPFDRDRWPQDKTPMRRLIIAGAFIAAEIDRRLRNGERP